MKSGEVFSAFMQALREGLEKADKNGRPLLMLAGPNGSGKSTLWNKALYPNLAGIAAEWAYINADEEVRAHVGVGVSLSSLNPAQLAKFQKQAQANATKLRNQLIIGRTGKGIVFETLFSDTEGYKQRELQLGRQHGFLTVAIFIGVSDLETLINRVARREAEGEHGVDLQKQLARYPRVLANMQRALAEIDLVVLVDNSLESETVRAAFKFLGVVENGELTACVSSLPMWAAKVLEGLACPKDGETKH